MPGPPGHRTTAQPAGGLRGEVGAGSCQVLQGIGQQLNLQGGGRSWGCGGRCRQVRSLEYTGMGLVQWIIDRLSWQTSPIRWGGPAGQSLPPLPSGQRQR